MSRLSTRRLRAATVLAVVVAATPAAPQQFTYRDAIEKYNRQEFIEALMIVRRLVERDDTNPAYHRLQGSILFRLDQMTEAEVSLRRAVTLDGKHAASQFQLGLVLLSKNKLDEALPALKRAVELDGTNLMARFYLGRASWDLNLIPAAQEQFAFVARRDPQFPAIHYHLARVHHGNSDIPRAIEELKAEVRLYPRNVLAQLGLGELLVDTGKPAEALGHLAAAEAAFPRKSGGFVVGKRGSTSVALQPPLEGRIYWTQGKALRALGKIPEAIAAAERALKATPDLHLVYYFLGQLYQEAGDPARARTSLELFKEFTRNHPVPP